MSEPRGFSHDVHTSGDVVISHHGRRAAVLRGVAAKRFLRDMDGHTDDEPAAQHLMARRTGNYRRGNEGAGGR